MIGNRVVYQDTIEGVQIARPATIHFVYSGTQDHDVDLVVERKTPGSPTPPEVYVERVLYDAAGSVGTWRACEPLWNQF